MIVIDSQSKLALACTLMFILGFIFGEIVR